MVVLGWNPWDVNMETDLDRVKEEIEEWEDDEKNKIKKEKKKEKKESNKKKKAKIIIENVIVEKEKNKDVNRCKAVNSKNNRCSNKVDKAGGLCAAHGGAGKKCSFIKPNKERCKLLAVNDDGRCNTSQHQPGYKK